MQIRVTIKPNSKHREEVVANGDVSLTVYTKAPAIDGRANQAAIDLLAKHFGVSKSQVRITRGQGSKHKFFEIDI